MVASGQRFMCRAGCTDGPRSAVSNEDRITAKLEKSLSEAVTHLAFALGVAAHCEQRDLQMGRSLFRNDSARNMRWHGSRVREKGGVPICHLVSMARTVAGASPSRSGAAPARRAASLAAGRARARSAVVSPMPNCHVVLPALATSLHPIPGGPEPRGHGKLWLVLPASSALRAPDQSRRVKRLGASAPAAFAARLATPRAPHPRRLRKLGNLGRLRRGGSGAPPPCPPPPPRTWGVHSSGDDANTSLLRNLPRDHTCFAGLYPIRFGDSARFQHLVKTFAKVGATIALSSPLRAPTHGPPVGWDSACRSSNSSGEGLQTQEREHRHIRVVRRESLRFVRRRRGGARPLVNCVVRHHTIALGATRRESRARRGGPPVWAPARYHSHCEGPRNPSGAPSQAAPLLPRPRASGATRTALRLHHDGLEMSR